MIALDADWLKCAELADFDPVEAAEVLGAYEGSADGNPDDNEWWMLLRMVNGRYGVLWGNDGATCSHCGAFNTQPEADFLVYATEAEARASIPIDVELKAWAP